MATKKTSTTAKKSTSTEKFVPIEVKATEEHPHGPHYELWEFPPSFPHLPGEHDTPEHAGIPGSLAETQCGATFDTQDVEQYDGTLGVTQAFVAAQEKPVGQLQWNNNLAAIYTSPGNVSGVRWCSGTLISCDLLITAGHCFDKTGGSWARPLDNATGNIIEPAEIATSMHVNFNYQRDPSGVMRTEESFPVTDLVEYRLSGLDFAVARLGGNPGKKYGWTHVATGDASEADMLAIIGHPNGVPKVIEAGPLTDLHGDRLGYNDIDTLGGSSGSGVLGPQGTIVGVHTNGGCNPTMTNHNHGVRISSILAASTTVSNIANAPGKFAQDGCQLIKLKFADDGKRPWADLKGVWSDRGDLKQLLDKRICDVKTVSYDLHGYVDPRVTRIDPAITAPDPMLTRVGRGRQPFVLSTPHHSEAMAAHDVGGTDILEAIGAHLEELHSQLSALGEVVEQLAGGQH